MKIEENINESLSILNNSWNQKLTTELSKSYILNLFDFIETELKQGKVIFPKEQDYFKAFSLCDFNNVKVVILGQDPYHGDGQAHGLSFSVPQGVVLPPSLKNIFKELQTDLGLESTAFKSGDLSSWAKQGVLLLNATLTVEKGKPGSHQKKGWEEFTDYVLKVLSEDPRPKVFILWGSYAIKKAKLIDQKVHKVIESVHPSPLSSYRGFFGSRPFSKANEFLIQTKQIPIDWSLKANGSD